MPKILVTGGAGYIGSHTAQLLLDAGHHVVVLDNLSNGDPAMVPGDADFVQGDVSDRPMLDDLLKARGIEAVLHFAGSIIVPESVENPLLYYRNNTVASQGLIEACVAAGIAKFIFSSTAAVYGEPEVVPVTEDSAKVPISPYGTSKLMTEFMLRDTAAAHDFRYVALRYFNVAGADPGGRRGQSMANATHLIKLAVQTALGLRDHLTIFGDDYDTPDGTGVRDYIHVADLADAHVKALGYLIEGGEAQVMNCGYGRGASVREVIAALEAVTGQTLPVEVGPRRAGDPPSLISRAERVRETLGWTPQLDDLETIVESALRWEKQLNQKR